MRANIRKALMYQPSDSPKRNKTRRCLRCGLYIHADMESCQPCGAATPTFSKLHRFDDGKKDDLVKRLRKKSKQGFAGAGGYGKDSVQYLCEQAADFIENKM